MEHLASGAERAQKRSSSRANHLWKGLRRAGKAPQIERPSPYGKGIATLFPWPVVAYPGPREGAAYLMERRADKTAIDNWRAGRRRAPQWAIILLLSALQRRRTEIDHALAILEKERAGD